MYITKQYLFLFVFKGKRITYLARNTRVHYRVVQSRAYFASDRETNSLRPTQTK
jgi:hypothetical protein